MKRTVLELLNQASVQYHDNTYVADKTNKGWQAMTYPQVKQEAEYIAAALLEHQLDHKHLAILAEGRSRWIVSEFAIIKAAGTSVPLSTKLLPEELPFRLNHSESKAIFTSQNTFEKVLSIWNQLEEPQFKLIYYDTDREQVKKVCEKYQIDICEHLLFYDDLLETGKAKMEERKDELDSIEQNLQEDDVVTISYTSGTTGNPKGIMLTQNNYFSNSSDAVDFFKIDKHLRTFVILPIDHSFAHTIAIYASLLVALEIYFVDARGGATKALKNIPINMKEVNPHLMLSVPALSGNFMNKIIKGIDAKGGIAKTLFDKGIQAGINYLGDGYEEVPAGVKARNAFWYKLADKIVFKKIRTIFGENMQYFVGGGALLDISQQRFFKALGVPIYQGYGLTEAAPIISANHPDLHKLGSSGRVMPTIEFKIMLADGTEAPKGTKGELVIRGNNVMKGYFKNEKASKESLRNGWLYTGDLAYVDKDDFLIVVGREKALLISADGEKYSPEGIEEAIANTSKMVHQVMVHNDHNKYTTALITLSTEVVERYKKDNKITEPKVLLEGIFQSFNSFKQDKDYANQFPAQWLPATFIILEEPFSEENHMINSTMKMVRHKIREAYQDKIDFMYSTGGNKVVNDINLQVVNQLFFNK